MWAVLAVSVLLSSTMLLAPIIFDLGPGGPGKVGEEAPAQLDDLETATGPGSAMKRRNNIHDLSLASGNTCILCHMRENSGRKQKAAWNPNLPNAQYAMYDSPTMDMRMAYQPQGISLACLSCHDGTFASDHARTGFMTRSNDLTDDHPVSVTYEPSRDRDFAIPVNGRVGTLPLYGDRMDQVECATCHDPHGDTRQALLRISNEGSALCFTCHNK
jgi:predicted CXXCH cytochrome family protein